MGPLDDVIARLRAVDWRTVQPHERSRVALMQEFLRRSALWSEALRCPDRWPFFDIAAAAEPDAPPPEIPADVAPRRLPMRVRSLIESMLRWAARPPAGQPGLPDPYEPLLLFFERGGGFTVEEGMVDVDLVGIPIRDRGAYLRDTPFVVLDAATLDALDRREDPVRTPPSGGAAASPAVASASAALVVAPELTFPALAARIEALGWRRDPSVRPFTPDVLPGEPELASWTLGDSEARVTYTLNPAVMLRVLTPAAVPDEARALLETSLPCIDAAVATHLLADPDRRRRLLGLMAAQVLAGSGVSPALRDPVAALLGHPDPLIAKAAQAAWEALTGGDEAAARREVLRRLEPLCREAAVMLAVLGGPEGGQVMASLRPQPGDFSRLFKAEIADAVRQAYDEIWSTPPRVEPVSAGDNLHVFACPATMLGTVNELSERFPGGYRALAPWLTPGRIWLVWRCVRPGHAAGMRYDGLVRLDERWVWLPKPYRVVGEILRSKGR